MEEFEDNFLFFNEKKSENENIFIRPVIVGNSAKELTSEQKKKTKQNTHVWNCYLRPWNEFDSLEYISKVVFVLHPTFDPPTVTVQKPPFEITQLGWGEFTISVEVYFIDKSLPNVTLGHNLRLFPLKNENQNLPVVNETYDQIIFHNPSKIMKKVLRKKGVPLSSKQCTLQCQPIISKRAMKFNEEVEESECERIKKALNLAKKLPENGLKM